MQAREYIRGVYRDVVRTQQARAAEGEGAFLAAALQVMQELESPLKEEALVRLAVLDISSCCNSHRRTGTCA